MPETADITIERLGAQGDGIAHLASGPQFIPFALPGESWRIAVDAAPVRLTQSPERAEPPCRHFGTCGGCVAQHMSDDIYNAWKRGIVADAFAHRGIAVEVEPLRRIATSSRRRAYFGVSRQGPDIVLGFREEGQHTLVDLQQCVILDPRIVATLPKLRALASKILPRKPDAGARLLVTCLDQGLDVSFETDGKGLSAETRQQLASEALAAGIARLSIGGDAIMTAGAATLDVGGVLVKPPIGIFLQAAPEAERIMTELILDALPKVKTIADLFCGLGTFTFALARRARVQAFDGDRRAISVLEEAAKGAAGTKPITAKVRDLFREPLSARELDGVDAAVFDPPRAGALAQCERLAKSKVKTVVAVSCNPATLARDARLLIDGGYRVDAVVPLDQFPYSQHVEIIAVFRR